MWESNFKMCSLYLCLHTCSNTYVTSSATAETARVGGHYAVQGHSVHGFLYQPKARIWLPSLNHLKVSKLPRSIGHIFAFDRVWIPLFNLLILGNLC